MSWTLSLSYRRTAIVVNYLSLVILALSIMSIEYGWGAGWPIAGIIIGLVFFTLTFIQIYGRTGLWKFVHMSFKELDERGLKIIHRSLRIGLYLLHCYCPVLYPGPYPQDPVFRRYDRSLRRFLFR